MYVLTAEISIPSALIQPAAVKCFWAVSSVVFIYTATAWHQQFMLRVGLNMQVNLAVTVKKSLSAIQNLSSVGFGEESVVLAKQSTDKPFGSF